MTMPALVPLGAHTGKPPIPLRRPVLLIGSRNIAHLHLISRKVSKAHALIINSDGKIYIRDLASRTHVYVNGEQIRQADLKNGDLIKIGSFTFRLTIPSAWQTRPRDTKAPPGQLNVDGVEIPVRLDERVTLIGRRPTCDISLLEDSASTAHAVIFEMGGRRFVRDLGSRTGTFVNGRKVHQQELDFGDVIRIGETDFRYGPASEIPTGPVPVDELEADFDELEDLVGTAPLMEEPPEVIAKRLEQEQADQPVRPAEPPVPAQSHAPIPLDTDEEQEAAIDDLIQPRQEVPSIPAQPQDIETDEADETETAPVDEAIPLHADEGDFEPLDQAIPLATEDKSEAAAVDIVQPRQEVPSVPAQPQDIETDEADETETAPVDEAIPLADELEQPADQAETAAAETDLEFVSDEAAAEVEEETAEETPVGTPMQDQPQPAPAGVEELDLLDEEAPATEAEIDLAEDLDLEAEPSPHDPEATHALPPVFKTKPRTPPTISDEIVDAPIVSPTEADVEDEEASAPPDLDAQPISDDIPTDASSDTVTLGAQTAIEEPTEEETEQANGPIEAESETETDIDVAPSAGEADELDAETIEPTAPTPQSAQSLEPELSLAPVDQPDPDALTDTGFDREIHAFAADSPEPVEEQEQESPERASAEADLDDTPLPVADLEPPANDLVSDDFASEDEDVAAEASDTASEVDLDAEPAADTTDESDDEDEASAADVLPLAESVDQPATSIEKADDFAELDLEEVSDTTGTTGAQASEEPFDLADTPAFDEPARESEDDDIFAEIETEQAAEPVSQDHDLDELAPIEDAPAALDETEPAAEAEEETESETEPQAPAAEAPAEKPSAKQDKSFDHGVNQWGFLGGAPLSLSDLPPPPPPARGGRATPRGAPFGQQPLPIEDLPAAEADEYNDPFAVQGEALPQIKEVDVFSQLGAPPEDDPFFGAAAQGQTKAPSEPHIPPTDADLAEAEASLAHEPVDHDDADPDWSSQDDVSDDPFDDLHIEDAPASATASHESQPAQDKEQSKKTRNGAQRPAVLFEEQDRPQRKRRWFFSVPLLFVMMLITASATAAAIWYTVPVAAVVNGSLEFKNLRDQPSAHRNAFFEQQSALLSDQSGSELTSTRERAKAKLREHYGNVEEGFLADPQAYALLVERSRQAWLNSNGGSIQLSIESLNPQADSQRLHALLLALFEGNRRLIDQYNNARHNADEVEANLRLVHEEITGLQARLDELKRQDDRPTTPAELAALKREIATLEKEWRAAEEAARQAQVEIERMREAAARATSANQPNSGNALALDDLELRQMEEQLELLNQRLQVTAVADNLEITRTRENMDAAIAQLEAKIEQVNRQMADVPEMKGYVTVANILQDTTHQLINELIHSQKQQLDTINALKRKLDEQLIARQNEVWANDPELQNLTALLDIQRRHYNAAIASDHPPAKEVVEELRASIARLEEQIEARRSVVGNDLIYADAIRGMEELIRTSEKRLAEDQKRTEERIAILQQQLAEAAPDLQKLPEEQKKLAAELEKQLVEMNEARKAYSDALARATDNGGDTRRELEAKALALRQQIETRRQKLLTERLQALSEQQQKEIRAQIQAKTDELNALQAAAREAHATFLNRSMHLAALESGIAAAVSSASKRDEIARELASAQVRRDQLAARKKEMDEALAAVIFPVEPMPAAEYVQISHIRDERPLYALISVGGIALVFGILMLTAHHTHTRSNVTQRVTEIEPPLFPSRETIGDGTLAPPHNTDQVETSPTA